MRGLLRKIALAALALSALPALALAVASFTDRFSSTTVESTGDELIVFRDQSTGELHLYNKTRQTAYASPINNSIFAADARPVTAVQNGTLFVEFKQVGTLAPYTTAIPTPETPTSHTITAGGFYAHPDPSAEVLTESGSTVIDMSIFTPAFPPALPAVNGVNYCVQSAPLSGSLDLTGNLLALEVNVCENPTTQTPCACPAPYSRLLLVDLAGQNFTTPLTRYYWPLGYVQDGVDLHYPAFDPFDNRNLAADRVIGNSHRMVRYNLSDLGTAPNLFANPNVGGPEPFYGAAVYEASLTGNPVVMGAFGAPGAASPSLFSVNPAGTYSPGNDPAPLAVSLAGGVNAHFPVVARLSPRSLTVGLTYNPAATNLVDFGSVLINTPETLRPVIATNTGNRTLRIAEVTFWKAMPSDSVPNPPLSNAFSLKEPVLPFDIPAGQSVTLKFKYAAPALSGTDTAYAEVSADSATTRHEFFSLTATAVTTLPTPGGGGGGATGPVANTFGKASSEGQFIGPCFLDSLNW